MLGKKALQMVVVGLAFSLIAGSAHAEGEIGKLDAAVYDVAPDAPRTTIPIELAVGISELSAKAVAVTLDDHVQAELHNLFAASVGDSSLRLEVTEENRARLFPGKYDVTIALSAKKGGQPVQQRVTARLSLPSGGLRPVSPLVLEVTVWGWPIPNSWVSTPSVHLVESTRRTALTDLTIRDERQTKHDTDVVAASLSGRSDGPTRLGRGASLDFPVAMDGRFPPGTSRGKLTVVARELGDPVAVDYEIRARRPGFYIFLLFVASGMVGWLLRNRLKKLTVLREAQVSAAECLRRLRRAQEQTPGDTALSTLVTGKGERESETARLMALGNTIDSLTEVARGSKPEPIVAAVNDAVAVLEKTKAWRAVLSNDILTHAAEELKVIDGPWTLPPRLAVDTVRAAWIGVRDALIADELKGAGKHVLAAETGRRELSGAIVSWCTTTLESLGGLQTVVWPSAARAAIQEAMQQLVTAIKSLKAEAAPPSATLKAMLPAVDERHRALRDLLEQIAHETERAYADVKAALDGFVAAGKAFADVAKPPIEDLASAASANEALGKAVGAAISALSPSATAAPMIAKCLKEGDHIGAIDAARPPPPQPPQADTETLLGGGIHKIASTATPRVPGSRASSSRPYVPRPRARNAELAQNHVLFLQQSAEPLATTLAQAPARLNVLEWKGALIAGAMLGMATWLLYGDTWVGSPRDFMTILALGFAANFTLDGVLDGFGKVKLTG